MSEKAARDLAGRLADAASRLSSWARDPGSGGGRRADARALEALDEAVRFVETAARDVLSRVGSTAEKSKAVVPERSVSVWNGLDDPLEGMRGHSRAFTIPELLSFVSVCHKTGILRVHTEDENFLVQLEEGMVVHARSDRLAPGETLAEILVARGAAKPEDVERFERTGALLPESFAQYLEDNGVASRSAVRAALELQVHGIFRRLTSAEDAYFRFYGGAQVRAEPDVRLNITRLLIESVRQFDEECAQPTGASDGSASIDPGGGPSHRGGRMETRTVDSGEEEPSYRQLLDDVVRGGKLELPLLDSAAGELLLLTWDEEVDAAALEERIARDQGLCAHLLRVANSTAFAPVVPVASVQLAVARLGLDRIRDIALALTVRERAFRVPGWEDEVRALWRRSAVTSGFARSLSRRVGLPIRRGSLVGLLQDVGRPVVLNALSEIEGEHGIELLPVHARALMDEYHGEVGAMLARHWALPDWLETVILRHHDLEAVDDHRTEVLLAHLAERLAGWSEDRDPGVAEAVTGLELVSELGLSAEQVRHVQEETDSILADASIFA